MDNHAQAVDKPIFKISEVGSYVTFVLMAGLTYSIARMYFYYVLLLHIPIFQYVDTTEIILSFPTAIFLILYVAPIFVADNVVNKMAIEGKQKALYAILLYGFVIFLIIIAKNNDPIVPQFWRLPLRYWYWGIGIFIAYVVIMVKAKLSLTSFFTGNLAIAILIIALWYGIFESFANYAVLTQPVSRIHFVMKTKNNELIKTDSITVFAGRTKSYWFLYNRKTMFVRAIKNDDIALIDYDTILK